MGFHDIQIQTGLPLLRPKLLIRTAQIGARMYHRARDLPAALPQGGSRGSDAAIVARLTAAERDCEEMRRGRSPAYRPGRHVQVLSALLAETASQAPDQANASGSEALRAAT